MSTVPVSIILVAVLSLITTSSEDCFAWWYYYIGQKVFLLSCLRMGFLWRTDCLHWAGLSVREWGVGVGWGNVISLSPETLSLSRFCSVLQSPAPVSLCLCFRTLMKRNSSFLHHGNDDQPEAQGGKKTLKPKQIFWTNKIISRTMKKMMMV